MMTKPMSPDLVVFVCSGGHRWTEWELEMGMTEATARYLSDQEELRHHLEADLDHEDELARAHVRGELDCPWPQYADRPYEVEEPEIFVA